MTAQLIDGKKIASDIKVKLKNEMIERSQHGIRSPGLAVILVGEDSASQIYVRNKQNACEELGIITKNFTLAESISEKELIELIENLNNDANIDGILLQLPLPPTFDTINIINKINPEKDVDGFHAYNLGRLAQRQPLFRPCTPQGIIEILNHINQVYKGKHAVMVGASNIVGRPMALELLIAGSTITVCHRFTAHLDYYVKQADILVSAVGKPNLIQGKWIKEGATVIDVGIARLPNGSIAGDVEFDVAIQRAAWITPVPGGVGPMTVAMLMKNTLQSAKSRETLRGNS